MSFGRENLHKMRDFEVTVGAESCESLCNCFGVLLKYFIYHSVKVESTRSRFTWVTDLVVMANANKLMVSFTDNTLAVYDIMTFDLQQQIVGLRNCILKMFYW